MHFKSPPHVEMECYFSGANVSSLGQLPLNQWTHILHTYEKGNSRIYVKGELSNSSEPPNAPLAIKSPTRFYIAGWYNHYDYVGDADVSLQFKAIFPDGVRTGKIEISIMEKIPEPIFTLKAPIDWNGRDRIEVIAEIINLDAMNSANADPLDVSWQTSPFGIIKESNSTKLILKRSQQSGTLHVTASTTNGALTAPNLISASLGPTRERIELVFDLPVDWNDKFKREF